MIGYRACALRRAPAMPNDGEPRVPYRTAAGLASAASDLPMTSPVKRICMWSGPRNVSTALLYSFAQRSDTEAVDEPLYAHFLRVSGARHPMRDLCLAAQDSDGERVVRDVILGPAHKPVVYFKQMAHHLVDVEPGFMRHTLNVFLTRDPEQMLPSLQKQIGNPTLRDTGFKRQCDILRMLEAWGQTPAVLDSRDLLTDPPTALRKLCEHLGLAFESAMLSWPAGPKPFDGAWAPHWYASVHLSTRFGPYRRKEGAFPGELRPLLEECRPYYTKLLGHAIRV